MTMNSEKSFCEICPRKCHAARADGTAGFCGVSGPGVFLARAALHFWEEPCISGTRGSGTVFFSGCNLRCVYCQNHEISTMKVAKRVSVGRLSEIFLELQEKNAHNLNLVTPTHYSFEIHEALKEARRSGFHLPVVWNSSGYEDPETLRLLEGDVDIYLTDFKYMDKDLAARFSGAPDYPSAAKAALKEMFRQKPRLISDENGLLREGVIVRHLLLPGHVRNAKDVVRYVYAAYGDNVLLSLMNQYTPVREIADAPELNRRVTKREYEKLIAFALDLGVTNAFIQEGGTQKESFIPAFDYEGI
ncbi:MAG: radical SAM protein [Lachnospiraceae bacterium]|nr:radical SAM protein [Lachnospiraceae bacterium]